MILLHLIFNRIYLYALSWNFQFNIFSISDKCNLYSRSFFSSDHVSHFLNL